MAKKLLITEKPSVAMEFAKALKINTTRKNNIWTGSFANVKFQIFNTAIDMHKNKNS